MPEKPLPEVAAFQVFLTGRVWVFGDSLPTNAERSILGLAIVSSSRVLLLARNTHIGKMHDGHFILTPTASTLFRQLRGH